MSNMSFLFGKLFIVRVKELFRSIAYFIIHHAIPSRLQPPAFHYSLFSRLGHYDLSNVESMFLKTSGVILISPVNG
jgi:hypothetical protein